MHATESSKGVSVNSDQPGGIPPGPAYRALLERGDQKSLWLDAQVDPNPWDETDEFLRSRDAGNAVDDEVIESIQDVLGIGPL